MASEKKEAEKFYLSGNRFFFAHRSWNRNLYSINYWFDEQSSVFIENWFSQLVVDH
jgi:hypothetical protein